jgi:hypothetical protein
LDEYHPDRNALECYARAEVLAEAERWIEDHIRSGCARCQGVVDELLPRPETPLCPLPRTSSRASSRGSESRPPLLFRFQDPSRPATAGAISESPAPGVHAVLAWPAARERCAAGRQPPPEPCGECGDCDGDACEADLAEMAEILGEPAEMGNEALDRIFVVLEHRLPLITEQRVQAPRLLGELLQRPAGERAALLCANRRFHTLALCKLLCDRSLEAGRRDSAECVALAELGIVAADCLDAGCYSAEMVHDMKAGAWACLGNARRLAGDFAGAEQALAFAEALAEEGTGDPLEEARLLELKASLLSDQGWFEEAAELLDTVVDIYDEVKELHLKGKTLITKGVNVGYSGWPRQAVELIRLGLAQLDAGSEPRFELEAGQDLAWFLNDCGHCDQAQIELDRRRPALGATGDAWTRLRAEWLDTRIALRSGRWLEAELRLDYLVGQLVGDGLGYEAALVMLDLAAFYLEHGRLHEVRRLADDMLPIFLSQDIHRQAVGALIAFQQAAAKDQLTPALVREIGSYLMRARKNPYLDWKHAA